MKISGPIFSIASLILFLSSAGAEETNLVSTPANDLTKLSLEDLMKIEVTSVSRSPEKLSQAPAAVTVITGDDIRRSGAVNIPEALRLAPGLDVAQVDAQNWAISSRGFNDLFANKLLVMMDGRTIYTPLFSGVFWDVQDTLMEDIDRIEVIRGPGASLWGANAVNGVINIITKKAKDTQGLYVSGGGGTEERGFAGVRYGLKFNDETYLRIYGKYFDRDSQVFPNGADVGDSSRMGQGGFRLDWEPEAVNLFTLQGDIYAGRLNETYTVPTTTIPFAATVKSEDRVSGGNLLGRWTHTISEDSETTLQAYYDRTVRNTAIFGEDRDTGDIDFQHRFHIGERHNLTWGGGYRVTQDSEKNTSTVSLNPDARSWNLFSAFGQDEITLQPDRWFFTLGSKFEHNDFTGFEVQPSARLLWTPKTNHSVWAAVSRAVRTPSRAEDDITINFAGFPPGTAGIHGNRDFGSEKLIAYEIGYKVQPHPKVSMDLAAFYNDYNDLRTFDLNGSALNLRTANNLFGETYGFELASTVQLMDAWRVSGGYTFLEMQLHRRNGSIDTGSEAAEHASPQNQVFLHSAMDLGKHVEFDQMLRFTDTIEVSGGRIPAYLSLDLRLAWKPTRHLELEIVGQNLLQDHHPEFLPSLISTQPTEIERGVYGKATFRF